MIDLDKINEDVLIASIEKELSERSLYEYFKLVLENVSIYKGVEWEMNWHYEEILSVLENELQRIIDKKPKGKDLILTLPFRSGKSTMLEIFATYCWVKKPDMKVLFIASNQPLAIKSARACKIIIESLWFRERWQNIVLMHDSKAKGNFSNTLGGQFLAFSHSNPTGRGGDILICDDLVQSSDAYSDTKLRNVLNNYRDGVHSRLNGEGLRILCQQRISAKDLVGVLKTTNPLDFREICLPAELTQDTSKEFRDYYVDGLFWKTRYSKEKLMAFKSMLTPTAYASQLLQSSSVFEGTYIKRQWIKIIKQSEYQKLNTAKTYLFIDTNLGGENKNNDPTGLLVCSVVNNVIYVLKFTEKWEQLYELVQSIIEIIKVQKISKTYIENASTGKNVLSELKRQLRGQTQVSLINTGTKSKEERVNAVQPYFVNGNVVCVEDDWNTLYLNYLADFNHGKHDEAVDLSVYAILTLLAKGYKSITNNPDKPEIIESKDSRGMTFQHDDFDMGDLYQ